MQGARKTTHFRYYVLISLKSKSCAGHNSYTVRDNLIIFGRFIYQIKKCCKQEGQLLLYVLISPETKILCRP